MTDFANWKWELVL